MLKQQYPKAQDMPNNDPFSDRTSRPAAVDFIDNRLPNYHPAFMNSTSHYDTEVGKYVPNTQVAVSTESSGAISLSNSSEPLDYGISSPRPNWTNIEALKCWNDLFPAALKRLISTSPEPSGRSKSEYSIRQGKNDWNAVYNALENAKAKYEQSNKVAGMLRKTGENIAPVAQALKIASNMDPGSPYSTPVLGAVNIFLDAVKTAANVRQQVLEEFNDIIPKIYDIEFFLVTFPEDQHISSASLDLTVSILLAIEQTIGFFISNRFVRGVKAIGMGASYETDLLKSLNTIKAKSKTLLEEAEKSQMHKFDRHSQRMEKGQQQVLQGQADLFNIVQSLLIDHEKQKKEAREKDNEIQRMHVKLEHSLQTITTLTIQNENLRSISPIQNNMWLPPPHRPTPTYTWYLSQDALRWMIKIPDADLIDISFIHNRKSSLSTKDIAQAEQIVHSQVFRNWIVSPNSAKLMVHWDFQPPKTIAGISPLSLFCSTITQGLRTKQHMLSVLWFCGRHIDTSEAGEHVGGHSMLASIIDQLLRQHTFDTRSLSNSFNMASLQQNDYNELLSLFDWLVKELPNTVTLFCIIDGVALFEREEYWERSAPVFLKMVNLSNDLTVPAFMKILFTSTPGTDMVRGAFEQEDLILEVGNLLKWASAPSEERMARVLEE
ncbi:hypothetical protein CFAM422_010313 [Trichoderma lentiforme]|uniref:Nephrocystin 3-like N-terminal domain-containing protein n=1 Tax=Trichoderma lentiforme TaxID=1567552 RepID=A0A9P4X8F5_9HYPO|nr:hypothetical protein CFAM422_010313 [Trichoderma lentiforme]